MMVIQEQHIYLMYIKINTKKILIPSLDLQFDKKNLNGLAQKLQKEKDTNILNLI